MNRPFLQVGQPGPAPQLHPEDRITDTPSLTTHVCRDGCRSQVVLQTRSTWHPHPRCSHSSTGTEAPGAEHSWRQASTLPRVVCARTPSRVQLFVTPWAVACQAPLSMGLSRQECWSELSFPPAGDLPHPGIEPRSPVSPASVSRFLTTSATWEAPCWLDLPSKETISRVALMGVYTGWIQ